MLRICGVGWLTLVVEVSNDEHDEEADYECDNNLNTIGGCSFLWNAGLGVGVDRRVLNRVLHVLQAPWEFASKRASRHG